jgi:hypothetical protein
MRSLGMLSIQLPKALLELRVLMAHKTHSELAPTSGLLEFT